jgi:anti-anti-sigma factor
VPENFYPVRWTGQRAVMSLPEQVGVSNVGPIREQMLAAINRGAAVLVVDLTDTVSCDHAAVEAIERVYQRALASGTELRLVVSSDIVRRVLAAGGLDRVVSIYPFVSASLAARRPGAESVLMLAEAPAGQVQPDTDVGVEVALLDRDGVIVWVNDAWRDFAAANGGDLSRAGTGVSYLDVCAAAGDDPTARDVAAAIRAALAGDLPEPAEIEMPCHSPRAGRWYDVLISARHGDNGRLLGGTVTLSLARSQHRGTAAQQEARLPVAGGGTVQVLHGRALLDRITSRLYQVGVILEAASSQSPQAARRSIAEALRQLDAMIREIRDSAFVTR